MNKISKIDVDHLKIIRKSVDNFMQNSAATYDKAGKLLDIAPQDHAGAAPFFQLMEVSTLDIDPQSNADYIADICKTNADIIPANTFDIIICTEVLEHTLNPFDAVEELKRILKPKGKLLLTVPFNLRIHGPLPDCWRFTEHGLRALLKEFSLIQIDEIPTEDRWLMPVHYQVVAEK
ncbi:methyltransferase family protein [Bacillus coahuilensis p1.1.43]|uniref:Methyltransferase family protein n=1 Tax=Bacillus coahuilensis p1.1.43 TaxID=1150625 RepID=A0A147K661_9BACI|nr:class I SAM-dependent methyltransferase [Bacillus coahuilensis]KUP05260.1 methyltransferase family protein [Bacillus coahuilensis p1.1.43]